MKKKKKYDWLMEFEKLRREGGRLSDREVAKAIKQDEKKRTKEIMNQPKS